MPIIYEDSLNFPTEAFAVQNVSTINVSADFAIRKSSTAAVSDSFTIRKEANAALSESILVRNPGSSALSETFAVQNKGAKALSSSFTNRKSTTKAAPSSFTIRKSDSITSHEKFAVRNQSGANLICNFWISKAEYAVERINNLVTVKEYTPVTKATTDSYATALEDDVVGYSNFSILIAAGAPNDITYRIQESLKTSLIHGEEYLTKSMSTLQQTILRTQAHLQSSQVSSRE